MAGAEVVVVAAEEEAAAAAVEVVEAVEVNLLLPCELCGRAKPGPHIFAL